MKLNSNKLLLFSLLEANPKFIAPFFNAESKIAVNNYFM